MASLMHEDELQTRRSERLSFEARRLNAALWPISCVCVKFLCRRRLPVPPAALTDMHPGSE